MTLCYLLSSWQPLSLYLIIKGTQCSPLSRFCLILPSPTNPGCLAEGIPLYIPFGMSLNQKSLLDGTWTRSLISRTMAMQSFATKEALLTKQSTCSMCHGFKQRVMGSVSFQFHQPLRLWESPPQNPKSQVYIVKGFADDLIIISQHEHAHASVALSPKSVLTSI